MIHEGENAGLILEEEIQELEEKLEEVQRRSPRGGGEARKCCNFDKKASALRRRMEKLGPTEEELAEEKRCIREIRELAEASLGGRQYGTSEKVVSGRKTRLAYVSQICLSLASLIIIIISLTLMQADLRYPIYLFLIVLLPNSILFTVNTSTV